MIEPAIPVLLAVLLNPFSQPLRHEQRIGDDQPFPTKVSQLPDDEKLALISALQPVIASDLQADFGEDDRTELSDDVKATIASLRSERFETPEGPLTLVQAYTPEGCGAVGNCRVWALDRATKLLLRGARGEAFALVTESHRYPNLIFAEHESAGDRYLRLYRFDGRSYVLATCGWSTMGYPGHYHSRPQISTMSCTR